MDFKELRRRMRSLEELTAAWENEGRVDTIEKDIALALLREIYGELRFGEASAESVKSAENAAGLVAVADEIAEKEAAVQEPEPKPEIEPEVEPVPEPVAEPVAEPEPAPEVESEQESVARPESEPVVPKEPVDEPVEQPAPEPSEVAGAAKEPEPEAPQKPVIHRRVDPDVIRSLYGNSLDADSGRNADSELMREHSNTSSSPHSRSADNSDNSRNADSGRNADSELMREHSNALPSPHSRSGRNANSGGNDSKPVTAKTTLADTVGEGRHTLGESLRNGQKDMASKIASTDRSSLRASIGLNDRFLMIRDMFEGNAHAFDDAITVLDGFTDLDEAVIHIHETYEWNADCEGVKLLVELLERKLG